MYIDSGRKLSATAINLSTAKAVQRLFTLPLSNVTPSAPGGFYAVTARVKRTVLDGGGSGALELGEQLIYWDPSIPGVVVQDLWHTPSLGFGISAATNTDGDIDVFANNTNGSGHPATYVVDVVFENVWF